RAFGVAYFRHEVGVALCVRGVLVVGEERRAARDEFVERTRQARIVQRQEGDAVAAVRGHVAQFVLVARGLRRGGRAPLGAFPFARRQRLQVARRAFGGGGRVADDAGGFEHRV